MRVQCDVCENAMAEVICCADEAALCLACDQRVHAANKLASKHQRLRLRNNAIASSLPQCDICQEKSALIFCLEDRAVLCRDCDVSIHASKTLAANHQRFLTTGVRVALDVEQSTPEAVSAAASNPLLPPSHHCNGAASASLTVSSMSGASTTMPNGAGRTMMDMSQVGQAKMKNPTTTTKVSDKKAPSKAALESVKISYDWQAADVLNFPDFGTTYGLGVGDMKGDIGSLCDEDWMALLDEHFCAESLAQVPQISPTSTPVPQYGRTDGAFKSKYKPDIGLVPNFDDASVVPDIASYADHVPSMKRQKMMPGL